jgi:hypothetical protein
MSISHIYDYCFVPGSEEVVFHEYSQFTIIEAH